MIRSIARVAALALTAVALLPVHQALAAAPAAPLTSAPLVQSFPTFGVDVVPPAGWKRGFEDDRVTVARWHPTQPAGAAGKDLPSAELQILITRGDDPQQEAQKQAQKLDGGGGRVEQTTLDGIPAFHLIGPRRSHDMIFAAKGDWLYVINYARSDGGYDPRELEAFRAAWKWRAIDPPAKHTELDPGPVLLLDRIGVLLPDSVRPENLAYEGSVILAARNYATPKGDMDLIINFSISKEARGMTAAEMARALSMPPPPGASGAAAKFVPLKDWKPLGTRGDRMISAPAQADAETFRQLAVIVLDRQSYILAQFTTNARTLPTDREALTAMTEKIVATVEDAAPPAPAPAPQSAPQR